MKYKTIINRSGKKIDLHICQTQDGSYIIGIPEGMKDNAEMFVEMYNSGGKQANSYVENVQHAMTDKGNPIEKNYADFVTDSACCSNCTRFKRITRFTTNVSRISKGFSNT